MDPSPGTSENLIDGKLPSCNFQFSQSLEIESSRSRIERSLSTDLEKAVVVVAVAFLDSLTSIDSDHAQTVESPCLTKLVSKVGKPNSDVMMMDHTCMVEELGQTRSNKMQ